MNFRILIITTLLLFNYIIKAQTFEKHISTPEDEMVYDAILFNNNEVVFAINHGEIFTDYRVKILKLNHINGNINDSIDIEFNYAEDYYFSAINQILRYNDTLFIGLGSAVNKVTNDRQLYIFHLNDQFEVSFDTLTGDINKNDSFNDFIINSDGNIISVGSEIQPSSLIQQNIESETPNSNRFINDASLIVTKLGTDSILLFETDIWGLEINRKLYSHPANFASTIMENIETQTYHLYKHFDSDRAFDIIDKESLEIDTLIEYPMWFVPRMCTLGLTDSVYYVAGSEYQPSGSVNNLKEQNEYSLYYLSYLEVRKDGTPLNYKTYDTDSTVFYSYKTFEVTPENIFISGTIGINEVAFLYPEQRWIILYKLDHQGEVIWQKIYKGDVNYMVYRILQTPDNGLLLFSTRYDWNSPYPNQRDVHILKIDSDGNYIPVGMDKPISNQKQILVWPNPARNQVNFTFGLMKDLQIDIFDVHGRLVFSEFHRQSPIIDLSGFSSGLYVYSISDEDGFLERGKLVVE